jgi:hypothetical protein
VIEALGHRVKVRTTANGNRFVALCTCGWIAKTAPVERVSHIEAAKHIVRIARGMKQQGQYSTKEEAQAMTDRLSGTGSFPDEGLSDEAFASLLKHRFKRLDPKQEQASTKLSHPANKVTPSRT